MAKINVCGESVTPSKILCVGRNYVAHIEELGNSVPDDMVVFGKPPSAIGDTLQSDFDGETLHYEGEIAFVVSNGGLSAVGFGLDLTRRELQSQLKSKSLPWERAKAFDGAALFSDFVPVPEDRTSLSLRLDVDGETRQQGGVDLMLYPPDEIIVQLQRFTTLVEGDVIMTGTPAGVGPVLSGERFDGYILAGDVTLVGASWTAR
ncbi:MAG: fumarylacetoacetate hydrolase family protein [Pseudomonadota bacterium]